MSLTILHTSDIHSRLYPYDLSITQVDETLGLGSLGATVNVGGVARVAYILNRERARSARVLHLDSGDCFQGAPIFNFFKGEPEVRAMSQLGVDVAVVGNHEFDSGAQNLATQMQRWSAFPLLSANYKFDNTSVDSAQGTVARLGTVTAPFTVLDAGGLKVAVIGMANLSSLTSIFDQPNRLGITPLNTTETLQFYVDLLRPYVDVVGVVSHMGLENDQQAVRGTTGIDFIMGGHNHIVINPPQQLRDCSADPQNPGYIWAVDPNAKEDPDATPPDDPEPALKGSAGKLDPINHPWMFQRPCRPRSVIISHSGAFAKYVGRLDLVLTNEPTRASPTGEYDADGDGKMDYDPVNGFEVQTLRYQSIPVTDSVPEDPVMKQLLEPYHRVLDNVADLDTLVGFSPDGSKRIASSGGDSPLGNVIGNAIWLRLGIQTDFSLTNSTGIRTDLNQGPVTIEQMYQIFPFDNTITKMQVSGVEIQELFDFSARRSSGRGCASQVQIAGARVRLNCNGCDRLVVSCQDDATCIAQGHDACDQHTHRCVTHCPQGGDNAGDAQSCEVRFPGSTCSDVTNNCEVTACAEQIYVGNTDKACQNDGDCGGSTGSCFRPQNQPTGRCQTLITPTNLYELATSNYLAGGGSGFRVLQRNTTQLDTKIQQRDALIDYIRAGQPCDYDKKNGTPEGLKQCSEDADCGDPKTFVCACAGHSTQTGSTCQTQGACSTGNGRCVRTACRDQVAQFHARRCADAPNQPSCNAAVNACSLAGEECKVLSCIDASLGSFSDGRVEMIGQ